jgi:PTH1 family peptidyl-tRNA hydrolase
VVRALVGLGNPGPNYLLTRHNLGHWWIDALTGDGDVRWRRQSRLGVETAEIVLADRPLVLVKSLGYMNESGGPVRAFCAYRRWTADDLLVAHDDLDLPVGTVRLKRGGGDGGHNGLKDLIAHLGPSFVRLRFGIGRPPPGAAVVDYVLAVPPKAEREALIEAVRRGVEILPCLLTQGVEKATARLHAPPAAERGT